ncbi:thiamine phosphate synthase [Candidatus Woesearchaeota archaeon]|nr:thiamine phosphate synthase [Candidatus Woesearchaeota archaeon]
MKKEKLQDIDLYFITDSELTKKTVLDDVKAAIAGGVKIVQYREKEKSTKEMIEEAQKIKEICGDDVIFLIDDRVDVALAVGADGVHLGPDDMPYGAARKLLGDDKIIGLTARDVEGAVKAEKLGADYVGIGPIYETATKLSAGEPVGIEMIEKVKNAISIPFVAIGGINYRDLDSVLEAGATKVAAISAIVAADDVEKKVKRFIDRLSFH